MEAHTGSHRWPGVEAHTRDPITDEAEVNALYFEASLCYMIPFLKKQTGLGCSLVGRLLP